MAPVPFSKTGVGAAVGVGVAEVAVGLGLAIGNARRNCCIKPPASGLAAGWGTIVGVGKGLAGGGDAVTLGGEIETGVLVGVAIGLGLTVG